MKKKYHVFVRTWWVHNPNWPNGLEPKMGEKEYLLCNVSYAIARSLATQYNKTHNPGKLSKKAEIEEA